MLDAGDNSAAPLALVLSGGGARSAYQAGLLAGLASRLPDLRPEILTGVSAGAINVAHLAAHRGSFAEATAALVGLWRSITLDQVFRTRASALAGGVTRIALRLLSAGRSGRSGESWSLLDTRPLRRFLATHLPGDGRGGIEGIERNLAERKLLAAGVTTLDYGTGQTVTWVQGREAIPWSRGRRRAAPVRITVDHVMASAALPIAFPAIPLAGSWHGDGGVRLLAPMSPALKLGAGKILAISTRAKRSPLELLESALRGYPSPAHIAGQLLSSAFLDLFDQDADRLQRVNALCRAAPGAADELGFRVIETRTLRPSSDLAQLATPHEPSLPRALRFATRGLGTRDSGSPDFLSLLLFLPGYIEDLLAAGERDAELHVDAVAALLAA